jgi:23S rRNA (guanosine2251-2'-O)-methyltransferase
MEQVEHLGLGVEVVSKARLDNLSGGGVHQGVVLRVAEFSYVDLAEVTERAKAAGQGGLVLVLDGIEDPHNFGALIRSALAFGVQGVVVAKDRAVGVTGTVVKASAGSVAHMAIARVTNLARSLQELKQAGLWVVGADPEGNRSPESVDCRSPIALVVGGEGAGIRRLVLEKCDFRVRIPISARLGSLNASVAGAVLLYEISRQRGKRA